MNPYYEDDAVTIYHGDCLELIDGLAFDLIVTDPPYGIDASRNRPQPGAVQWADIASDSDTAAAEWLCALIGSTDTPAVVFGANCFPHALPHRGRWICWDKRMTDAADRMLGSPFELAWCNRRTGFDRMVRVLHGGVVNDNSPGHARWHPTEKPMRLMRHVINDEPPGVILDPFMGSGTTLRAAKDLGRKAIGIEIEERYCEIAAKRMGQEVLAL